MSLFFCVSIRLETKCREGRTLYEALFIDIDGTLRDEALGIPDSAVLALQACKAQGCRIFLCTGRPPGVIQEDVTALSWDGIIAAGGSYIRINQRCLRNLTFSKEGTEAALNYLKTLPEATFAFETETTVYLNNRAGKILESMNYNKWKILPLAVQKQVQAANKISYKENLDDFFPLKTPANKICIWGTKSDCRGLQELLTKEPACICQKDLFGDLHYLELIRKGCNKGDAIRLLCNKLGISPENALAFGDGKNDISMFQAVGTAVAMGGADRALLPYAQSVCETPMGNGIYLELIRRNLIKEKIDLQ